MADNQMTTTTKKVTFGMFINGGSTKQIINRVIPDKKKLERYITAIISAVGANPELEKCTFPSILTASLLAESLNLAHSPQLGQYYMVPFKVKEKRLKDASGNWTTIPEHYEAQFILGLT